MHRSMIENARGANCRTQIRSRQFIPAQSMVLLHRVSQILARLPRTWTEQARRNMGCGPDMIGSHSLTIA
jgi:hypothetical protein